MKKNIVSTLALSAIALMSGCGGGGDSAGSNPAGGGSAVTTYTVGGTLTVLATGASISLLNNGGDTLNSRS